MLMGDMSTSMCVNETLSASRMSPVGDKINAMTRIPDKASCQTLYSSRDDSLCEQATNISNEANKIEMPESDETAIIYSRQKCPLKLHSATKTCEISTQQLVILQNQSNRSCLRQITKGLLADQNKNDSIKINCDGQQNNNNDIEGERVLKMSSNICWNRNKARQGKSTIWNYDNCYHTCSFDNNKNTNNIDCENGGQKEKRSHNNNSSLGLFSTSSLCINECSTKTKTTVYCHHVISNFVAVALKISLAPFSLSSSVSVMNKLFVNSSMLLLLCLSLFMSCGLVSANPIAGPGSMGANGGSALQQGGGLLPFPEGKTQQFVNSFV